MTEVIGQKTVKTRKDHVCFGCGRNFPKGTLMERSCVIDSDGKIASVYIYAAVILGGLIIVFGLLWLAMLIMSKAIFELAAHCRFWGALVEEAIARVRAKENKE